MSTGIEWTDETWNPVTGCTKVSPGCDNCYAKTMHERFNGPGSFDTVTLHPERLDQPLRWTKPRRIFVNSMADLFHDDIPREYVARVFAVMATARRHTFQVLTKRHARMRSLLTDPDFLREVAEEASELIGRRGPGMWPAFDVVGGSDGWRVIGQDDHGANIWAPSWPLSNVWLGVSVENQKWADIRIPALLDTPAAVRFISAEPLLGPVELDPYLAPWRLVPSCDDEAPCPCTDDCGPGLDWVIVGGESGPGARAMHPDWARSLRDQCVAADVPYLFKQWGESRPLQAGDRFPDRRIVAVAREADGTWPSFQMRVGKKAAGRELDGRTWDEYPQAVA